MSTLRTDNLSTTDSSLTIPLTDLARSSVLASSVGASLIGYGSSTVAASLSGLASSTPEQFGAVGNGVTDDTAAIVAALATGQPVIGGLNKVYAVTGNIILPANTDLRNISFKQLDPDPVNRRTLYMPSGSKAFLTAVTVDRNGSGTGGQMNNSAGIYIANCSDVRLERCEVTGDNFGDGIVVTDSRVRLYYNYVHDMNYGSSSTPVQTDDVMQGILLIRCTGERVGNRVERLKGQWTGQALINRFSRGIALGGCFDMDALGDSTDTTDQGFDYSGGENNRRISTVSCRANNSYTWGFKAANTVTDSTYTACISYRSGLGAFVASAPTSTLPGVPSNQLTQNIVYTSCIAIETGVGGAPSSSTQAAFQALNSVAYTDFPRGIKWVACRAYGGSSNRYGFKNDVAVTGPSEMWNEAIECESRDHTIAAFLTTNSGILMKRSASTQSIPNNNPTIVTLDTVMIDRMSGGSTNTIQRAGIYSVIGNVTFPGNVSGVRTLQILVNGVAIPGGTFTFAANASGTTAGGSVTYMLAAGDNVRLQVTQDSGVSLNISNAFLSIFEISKGQMV